MTPEPFLPADRRYAITMDARSRPPQEHRPDPGLIAERLIAWYGRSARDLPWRRTRDPYRIWIAEVMLQQTRVDQTVGYYDRFLDRFPTLKHLAEAGIDDVLLVWEGLGYYSRARNLHRAAGAMRAQFGEVPGRYEDLIALPGIGPYSAAAVSSIAFGRPHAVLDGNVIRVLARLYALDEDVSQTRTRRRLQERADALLLTRDPGGHNQAMMELGALICVPRAPACAECPVADLCLARAEGAPERYPRKTPRPPVPHHDVVIGILTDEQGRVLITRRPDEAMLGGLWEFPGGKREAGETLEAACRRELLEELGISVSVGAPLHRLSHAYTHFRITLHAFPCTILSGKAATRNGMPLRWVDVRTLPEYAFPRANRRLIEALMSDESQGDLFRSGLAWNEKNQP